MSAGVHRCRLKLAPYWQMLLLTQRLAPMYLYIVGLWYAHGMYATRTVALRLEVATPLSLRASVSANGAPRRKIASLARNRQEFTAELTSRVRNNVLIDSVS